MKKIILFFALTPAFCQAQDITSKLDSLVMNKYKADEPGVSVLVARGNQVLYSKAVGMADLENKVVLTTNHVFEIGSITKQFTAVSILMLEEEGKLSLNDSVSKFITGYPMQGHVITIHHLLNHTSGIKSYTSMERWRNTWRLDKTPQEMIDLFKNEPMEFKPGEKWAYNNSAYFMLGYIIEKASGMPYPEFLEKKIFTPLQMNNSYFGSMTKIIPLRARPYSKNDGSWVNAEYLSLTQPYAAGSIMSTVQDLYTWNKAVQAGRLVKKETLQKALTDYTTSDGIATHYGYGWGINEVNGSISYEHSGGIFGYLTNGIYLPKEDLYVIALSNRDDTDPGEMSIRMAALAIGKPYGAPASSLKITEAYAKKLTGNYDFGDGVYRTITYEKGKLFSQRTNNRKIEILPVDERHFVFAETLSMLEFVNTKAGQPDTLLVKNRIDVSKGVKTDQPLPAKKEIPVIVDTLQRYAGVYELAPGVDITITEENGHLMAQVTNQPKFELFPKGANRFFYKVVEAEIEFRKETNNTYSLMLFQGGREIPGKKK